MKLQYYEPKFACLPKNEANLHKIQLKTVKLRTSEAKTSKINKNVE